VINVSSELGRGTTFLIYLPAVEVKKESKEPPAAVSVGRKGRILVMDDEDIVRNLAGDLIRALGHEVELAKDGEAVIEKYTAAMESGRPFDTVILDLTVRGGLGGRETIGRLHAIDPDVRAIVSSGYSDDAVVADYEKHGFKAYLGKPYRLSELRDALNAVLSG